MRHHLKTDPAVFGDVFDGRKTFEIRKDDRGYQEGDELVLNETTCTGEEIAAGAELEYTGRSMSAAVTYILRGPCYGLADGWCIMSIEVTDYASAKQSSRTEAISQQSHQPAPFGGAPIQGRR